jgi:type II secretory pathway pseudopilin PulG
MVSRRHKQAQKRENIMRRRAGFTIVELLVALALILFVMVILTEAFSAGIDTFRQLKAIGDMQERMRSVAMMLRRDLQADHFDELRGARLSDQDMRTMAPPSRGYFRIWQATQTLLPQPPPAVNPPDPRQFLCPNSVFEGVDGDGIVSTRATTHGMAFTCRLHGNRRQDYVSTSMPAGLGAALQPVTQNTDFMGPADFQSGFSVMNGQWYEVCYFLRSYGATAAGGLPLFTLYRRVQLIQNFDVLDATTQQPTPVPNALLNQWAMNPGSVPLAELAGISFRNRLPYAAPSAASRFNTPNDMNVPYNRFGMPYLNAGDARTIAGVAPTWIGQPVDNWNFDEILRQSANPQRPNDPAIGDDIILTDLISFDIKVIQQGYTVQTTNPPPPGTAETVGSQVFMDLPPFNSASCLNPVFNQNAYPMGYPTPMPALTVPAGTLGWSVFDTWTGPQTYANWDGSKTGAGVTNTDLAQIIPLRIRILGLQITLRVWDEKTQQARQMTLIQDM